MSAILNFVFNADQFVEATAAASGGVVATVVLYPLEIVKNLMQSATASGGAPKGFMETTQEIFKSGGWAALYRGCDASSFQSVVEKGGYFYFYSAYRVMYENAFGHQIPAFANLVVGYISEWSHLPFSMPIETIMVRLQKGATGGPGEVAKSIMSESGMAGFYPGVYTQVVWALKPAIEYAVFEQIKRALLKGRAANLLVLGAFEAFFYGGVARAVATLITFPGNRAKMIMQGLKNSKDTTFMIELNKVHAHSLTLFHAHSITCGCTNARNHPRRYADTPQIHPYIMYSPSSPPPGHCCGWYRRPLQRHRS
jgi:hypothetical protein